MNFRRIALADNVITYDKVLLQCGEKLSKSYLHWDLGTFFHEPDFLVIMYDKVLLQCGKKLFKPHLHRDFGHLFSMSPTFSPQRVHIFTGISGT